MDPNALSPGESYVDPATVNGNGVTANNVGAAPAPTALDAWLSARLGNAIDIGVDRVINGPQTITGTAAYGIDPATGKTYLLGQPNAATVQTVIGAKPGTISPGLLLVGLILFLLVTHPGHA